VAAATATTVAATGGLALAAGGEPPASPYAYQPKNAAAARHLELERQALDLINRATKYVQSRRASCGYKIPHGPATPTHDVPAPETLAAIAALRRPATPADALPENSFSAPFGEVYVDYTRSLTDAAGRGFYLVVARSVQPRYRPSKSCLDAEHARLVTIARAAPHQVRSLALEEFGKIRHGQEGNAQLPDTPVDGIYLFTRGEHGVAAGGGGGSVKDFLMHGTFLSVGGGPGSARRSTLSGLVPDGVASVTLEYPRRVSRGPYFQATVYPLAYTRTVKVVDNVLSVHVPREAGDAFPPRMVWRDAQGDVIRVIKREG